MNEVALSMQMIRRGRSIIIEQRITSSQSLIMLCVC